MRIRVLVLRCVLPALLLVIPVQAAAQAAGVNSYGLKIGFNVADVSFEEEDESISTDSRAGALAGGFFARDMGTFGVQVEALVTQKGSSFDYFGEEVELRLTYVEIPVLGRFGFRATNEVMVRMLAGPTFGFLASDDQEVDGVELEDDEEAEFNGTDVGLAFGAAVEIRNIIVDARYTLGLTNIFDEDDDGEIIDRDMKNRAFSISVGWRF